MIAVFFGFCPLISVRGHHNIVNATMLVDALELKKLPLVWFLNCADVKHVVMALTMIKGQNPKSTATIKCTLVLLVYASITLCLRCNSVTSGPFIMAEKYPIS